MMLRLLPAIALWLLAGSATADITLENDLIIAEEIFDLKFALDSEFPERQGNETKYYCVFRNLWTPEDHPKDYPDLARWSNPAVFSHTKQYSPFIKNRDANYGVEIIAESGFTDKFRQQFKQAGEMVYDYAEGRSFYINKKRNKKNYRYLPPIKVSMSYRYISGISGVSPSPDWFTGFYHMDVIDEYDRVFWDSFKLHTYPWDAGTDDGQTYTDIDYERERPDVVRRFTPETAPNGVFVSPFGDEIRPVGEWECVVHSCPLDQPNCQKPDWPPANGCDILKYPECNNECDPKTEDNCQRCRRESNSDPAQVWYHDCCKAGYVPRGKRDCGSSATQVVGFTLAAALALVGVVALAF